MIERIIRASASRPALAVILAIAGTVFGAMSLQNLRRDVFPDLSAPVFNVIVQNEIGRAHVLTPVTDQSRMPSSA